MGYLFQTGCFPDDIIENSPTIPISRQQAGTGTVDPAIPAGGRHAAGRAVLRLRRAFHRHGGARGAREFWLNDFNAPPAGLLALIVNDPKELGKFYKELWRGDHADALEHYYQVRESFNRTQDARLLLYLLARCVKGAVRYNADGWFNQSPDKRRLGTQPATMQASLNAISALLRGKTIVTSLSHENVLANVREDDVVYMAPPYQGVCGERDSRYFSGSGFDDFVAQLGVLNLKNVRSLVSYDGRLDNRSYGKPLPAKLHLTLVELEAGRSSQSTLPGREEMTVESLYLSRSLAEELAVRPTIHRHHRDEQMQLMETPVPYGKTKISKRVS